METLQKTGSILKAGSLLKTGSLVKSLVPIPDHPGRRHGPRSAGGLHHGNP